RWGPGWLARRWGLRLVRRWGLRLVRRWGPRRLVRRLGLRLERRRRHMRPGSEPRASAAARVQCYVSKKCVHVAYYIPFARSRICAGFDLKSEGVAFDRR